MEHPPATILFFGRPGAGKSTQAEILSEYLRKADTRKVLPFIWSHVRDEFMRGNSGVQKKLQQNHAAGKLQPKFFSVSIWGPVLLRQLTGNEHLVIDGVPRQMFEAEALGSAFEFFDRTPVLVYNMSVSPESAATRMRARAQIEGRNDDANEESIKHRLEWFESDTAPILDLFKNDPRYIILDIDGEKEREEVSREIQDSLQRLFGSGFSSDRPQQEPSLEPSIIVSVGVPGAGKTTLLKPLADRNDLAYVSRDDIRKELFGNPILQLDKDRVWKEADRRVQEALAAGKTAVYDATFAEQKKRRDFIASLRAMGWKNIIGLYVNTPTELSRERNRNREHVVPEDELEKFFIKPLQEQPPSLEDGFSSLYTLKDIDALEVAIARD